MQIFLIILSFLLLAGLVFMVILYLKKKEEPEQKDDQGLLMIQSQISELANRLDSRLDSKLTESSRMVQGQFSESSRMIKEITQELTRVNEGQKQVVNFADQLKNLQDILKNPKQRGILGEYYLETVLKNVLPPGSYKMQYEFKDGVIVDAVVFVKEKIIPIDSKFSLENYNRWLESKSQSEKDKYESAFRDDLKTRIDETSKYIKPGEGTMEFAFMFIPAEAVYYDLLVNKVGASKESGRDMIQYAGEKKVLIVSPTTFLAYLQTVLQGLKALQVEESAKLIIKRIEELSRHLISYESYMKKLGGHLGTAVNSYNFAYKEFTKVDKDILRVTGTAMGIEHEILNIPEDHED
ncbi:MAG: DNA recombination protein RmuC [Candidatus Pacebacteria bacterium]|nr:DNA recombination protein RmuC [Candidatus Paceibacterota bacterium]